MPKKKVTTTTPKKKGPVPLSERWKPSKPGTQRRKVHDLYESGMTLKDIAKKLKLEYGNVSGHVSNYREGHKWNGTDKMFDEKGNVVSKKTLVKTPKKKVKVNSKKKKKKKPAPKKKVTVKKVMGVKVTTTVKQVSKKKAKELIKNNPALFGKPGPGTKVIDIPEDVEEPEEIPVDEFTGKPLF